VLVLLVEMVRKNWTRVPRTHKLYIWLFRFGPKYLCWVSLGLILAR
jgi:hypothetical protein